MLSIVKGVSRNRNISELGINYWVSTYVNRDSELHCSCPLDMESYLMWVHEPLALRVWLLASMYINTVCFMLLHCTFGP